MKPMISCIGIFLVLTLAAPIYAQKVMYVSDVIKITVRRGPGIDYKVLAMLESGERIEVLEGDSDWSKVRLPDGTEGWALTRFLTGKEPSEIRLQKIEEAHETLSRKTESMLQENQQLQEENRTLLNQVEETRRNLEQLAQSYENLKSESADFLKVKTDYEDAFTELQAQREKAEIMTNRVSELEWKRNAMWFLSGAGVFLLGFIIGGFNEKGKRRRSPYL
jgi:SH3 domain protein